MNLKQKLMAATVFFAAASSALADTDKAVPVATAFTTADVASLFDKDAQSLQLAALSAQEMRETEGAWGPWGAAIGGLGGFGGYAVTTLISGSQWSWTGAATSTITGAGAGAFAGPNGVIWGFNAALGTGMVNGVAGHYGWGIYARNQTFSLGYSDDCGYVFFLFV